MKSRGAGITRQNMAAPPKVNNKVTTANAGGNNISMTPRPPKGPPATSTTRKSDASANNNSSVLGAPPISEEVMIMNLEREQKSLNDRIDTARDEINRKVHERLITLGAERDKLKKENTTLIANANTQSSERMEELAYVLSVRDAELHELTVNRTTFETANRMNDLAIKSHGQRKGLIKDLQKQFVTEKKLAEAALQRITQEAEKSTKLLEVRLGEYRRAREQAGDTFPGDEVVDQVTALRTKLVQVVSEIETARKQHITLTKELNKEKEKGVQASKVVTELQKDVDLLKLELDRRSKTIYENVHKNDGVAKAAKKRDTGPSSTGVTLPPLNVQKPPTPPQSEALALPTTTPDNNSASSQGSLVNLHDTNSVNLVTGGAVGGSTRMELTPPIIEQAESRGTSSESARSTPRWVPLDPSEEPPVTTTEEPPTNVSSLPADSDDVFIPVFNQEGVFSEGDAQSHHSGDNEERQGSSSRENENNTVVVAEQEDIVHTSTTPPIEVEETTTSTTTPPSLPQLTIVVQPTPTPPVVGEGEGSSSSELRTPPTPPPVLQNFSNDNLLSGDVVVENNELAEVQVQDVVVAKTPTPPPPPTPPPYCPESFWKDLTRKPSLHKPSVVQCTGKSHAVSPTVTIVVDGLRYTPPNGVFVRAVMQTRSGRYYRTAMAQNSDSTTFFPTFPKNSFVLQIPWHEVVGWSATNQDACVDVIFEQFDIRLDRTILGHLKIPRSVLLNESEGNDNHHDNVGFHVAHEDRLLFGRPRDFNPPHSFPITTVQYRVFVCNDALDADHIETSEELDYNTSRCKPTLEEVDMYLKTLSKMPKRSTKDVVTGKGLMKVLATNPLDAKITTLSDLSYFGAYSAEYGVYVRLDGVTHGDKFATLYNKNVSNALFYIGAIQQQQKYLPVNHFMIPNGGSGATPTTAALIVVIPNLGYCAVPLLRPGGFVHSGRAVPAMLLEGAPPQQVLMDMETQSVQKVVDHWLQRKHFAQKLVGGGSGLKVEKLASALQHVVSSDDEKSNNNIDTQPRSCCLLVSVWDARFGDNCLPPC